MPLVNGDRFFPSTAVLLAEVIKLSIFLSIALYEVATGPQTSDAPTIGQLAGLLSRAIFTGDSWKLALPALLYTIQNTLLYVVASNLDAATWAVTSQAKLVSTAVFSAVLLGRGLDVRKWLSLGLMAVSIAVVQISFMSQQEGVLSMQDLRDGVSFHSPRSIWDMEGQGNKAAGQLNVAGGLRKRSATYEGIDEDVAAASPRRNASVGLAAALATGVLAGIAGVYFERVLKTKDSRVSVYTRNVQLSLFSLLPALFVGVIFTDGEHLARTGFFTGYSWVVWVVIVLQAAGGVSRPIISSIHSLANVDFSRFW
jgi:drug/metabolite transporter (DMT)-like permease